MLSMRDTHYFQRYKQVRSEKMEKEEGVTDFIFLGSKITMDADLRLEIKRCLLLGRRTVTNLNSILKSETSL